MHAKKKRVEIPTDMADAVMVSHDRTCCVCRKPGKSVQIHHINNDPSNNEPDNLAVLCLECHDDTQIRGGFGRGLSQGQVSAYRESWTEIVSERRTAQRIGASGATGSTGFLILGGNVEMRGNRTIGDFDTHFHVDADSAMLEDNVADDGLQTTPGGHTIPVPTRQDFDQMVKKVAPLPAGHKPPGETAGPPEQSEQ